jgi:prepilin-type N-terminal cleavage/methylation domain-containing protein
MKRRAFTMVELMFAVMLVGVLTTLSVFTFNAVSRAWQGSTDYMDKMQRTDFALNQVTAALRSMYYPHDGSQDDRYGFMLMNNGDGEDPRSSDVVEWSKTGSAIVGNKSSVADTVHRVRVMVLEEGNHDYRDEIEVTGLYARQCPDVALRPKDNPDDIDFSFSNEDMYQPVLIADGIVGFNCRVLKTADKVDSENDRRIFEDEFAESNSVPYKVELTFRIADPEGRSYRSNTAPVMRIVRIPIHEQSLDGAETPSSAAKDGRKR